MSYQKIAWTLWNPPWLATACAFAAVGYASMLALPDALIVGFGHAQLPAQVHLFTLGAVLTAFYGRWLGTAANWIAQLSAWSVWGMHVSGALIMVWGLWKSDGDAAYLGGHYLVPMAIGLAFLHLLIAEWRSPDRPRRFWALVPPLGLLVAMSFGVMLLLDRFVNRYDTYSPQTVALHVLSAAFLLVLPGLAAWERPPADPGTRPAVVLRAGVGAFGLLAIVLAPYGLAWGIALGLGLLAAIALWEGLPPPADWRADPVGALARLPWAIVGILLGWLALRMWRGGGVAEIYSAGMWAGVAFVLGAALPRTLWGLWRLVQTRAALSAVGWGSLAPLATMLAGGVAIGAGQAAGLAAAVQAGAGLSLAGITGLASLAWVAARRG